MNRMTMEEMGLMASSLIEEMSFVSEQTTNHVLACLILEVADLKRQVAELVDKDANKAKIFGGSFKVIEKQLNDVDYNSIITGDSSLIFKT